MKPKARQSGLTLIEQTMVIAAAAILILIAIPAARTLFDQLHTPAGVRATISSALASAKAIAAQQQKYAGIRFQHAYDRDRPFKSPQTQPQYIIFIVYDSELARNVQGNLGCRAVEGLEPIELPRHIGVMDLLVNQNDPVDRDDRIDDEEELIDATTFSILFSPSGKLVVHDLWVRNRDDKSGNRSYDDSEDDIFNTEYNVDEEQIAKFLQDDYPLKYRLDKEPSRRSFIIYDRNEFRNIDKDSRYSDYLEDIEPVYLNPYTGTMINR